MAIVVTGAAGFIGSNLVGHLRGAGREVVGIDRRHHPVLEGVRFVKADLSEPSDEVDAALNEADMVLHLAGCPGVRDRSPDIAGRRHRDNVLAARRVLEATPQDTMVVLASSSSVYGGSDGTPCRETQAPRPRGGYAISKVDAERLCATRAAGGGAVVAARLFTVAGERQRPDMALSRWITDISAGRAVQVYGSLERTRDITDVRDVCAAVLALAENQVHGVVNVGTGTSHTLGDLLSVVGAALDQEVRVDLTSAGHDDPHATLADPTRLFETTGLRPTTDLNALVRRQVAAMSSPGHPDLDGVAGDEAAERNPVLTTGALHDV